MHVGLITYQTGHWKTLEIALRLIRKGHFVTLLAFPFVQRAPKAEQRFQDRPSQIMGFDPEVLGTFNYISYRPIAGWTDHHAWEIVDPDIYLHCTAKIIPASFIAGRTILNCHPGLLPQNRGVDALKWALLNGRPLGVSLHAIDQEIDRGTILKRMPVPVFPTDELADVCQRMYDYEIDLLGNFEHHLDGERIPVGDEYPCSHVKIPIDQDQRLEQVFREYRSAVCNDG